MHTGMVSEAKALCMYIHTCIRIRTYVRIANCSPFRLGTTFVNAVHSLLWLSCGSNKREAALRDGCQVCVLTLLDLVGWKRDTFGTVESLQSLCLTVFDLLKAFEPGFCMCLLLSHVLFFTYVRNSTLFPLQF